MMPQKSATDTLFKTTLKQRIAYCCYATLMLLMLPLLGCHWLITTLLNKPGSGKKRLERFGIFPFSIDSTDILIHCVSVGEVNVAVSLIKYYWRHHPDIRFTVTTTTPTGANQLRMLLEDKVQHLYLPVDIGFLMSRLLTKTAPSQVLIVEVELWPAMLKQCAKRCIPVSLINGRMTDKSVRGYQRVSALLQPALNRLSVVCAQSQRDYQNYLKLGLAPDKCIHTGNIKFDLTINLAHSKDQFIRSWGIENRFVLVGGSTHDPEEQLLLDAFVLLKKQRPDALLVVVPRHPRRFQQVVKLLDQASLSVARATDATCLDSQTDVLLVDQMGALNDWYQCADVAFVGGSIAPRGGHNALEPAFFGVPILMGPSRHNNPEICQQLAHNGALLGVENSQQIAQQCETWLANPQLKKQAAEAGKQTIEANRGALKKTFELINRL